MLMWMPIMMIAVNDDVKNNDDISDGDDDMLLNYISGSTRGN